MFHPPYAALIVAAIGLGIAGTARAADPASASPRDDTDGRVRDETLISAQNGFALKKLDGSAAKPALVVPASAGNHAQNRLKAGLRAPTDPNLAGLQSPGAFRAVPLTAITDSRVVRTSGEYPLDSGKTAMLPLPPPTNLREGQGAAPLPRAEGAENAEAPSPLPAPGAAANEGSGDLAAAEKCKSPRSLKSILNITADIAVKPKDLSPTRGEPPECSLGDEPAEPRHWQRMNVCWSAAATWHKPIYFEDDQMERYGHTFGPVTQTTLSAVKFFATVPLVPYYMGVYPPHECIYDLGTYRPGDCCPYYLDPFPLSIRGAINEMYLGILPAL